MAEISNGTLALLVLAALAVVVTTTTLQLNGGITGFATSGSGTVNLTIANNLAIEVVTENSTIDFGTCRPQTGVTQIADTNVTPTNTTCDAAVLNSTEQRIQVRNIGNVNATVNVTGECGTQDFLPTASGTGSAFEVSTYSDGTCAGTMIGSYQNLTNTTSLTACSNLEPQGSFWMPARVRLPGDTLLTQNCGGNPSSNTITFDAEEV